MNDNQGGTPNPLNAESTMGPTPNTTNAQPIGTTTTSSGPTNTVGVPTEPIDPMNRPMEQAAIEKPARKKGKVGAIIGIIILGLVLIGGGITAALLIANMNKKDPVVSAMSKIMRGEAPANMVIDGSINIAIENELSPLENIKITLNSGLVRNSLVNNSVATVTITMQNIGDFTLEFDEIYVGDGNLYFRADGLNDALEESGILYLINSANEIPEVIDCGDDDYCSVEELSSLLCVEGKECVLENLEETDFNILGTGMQDMLDADVLAYFGAITDNIDIIDGTWLKVSVDDLNDYYEGSKIDSDISCITTLVDRMNTGSSSAAEAYNNNPFIISAENTKTIASKGHTVYQVEIDNANFANFVNSMQNPSLTADLYSCLGWNDNVKITEEDVASVTDSFPVVFVEVDEDDNFSRLYMKSELTSVDGCECVDGLTCDCTYTPSAIVTIDLNFSYPANINITEPDEYMDYSGEIKEIMSGMFNL